MALDDIEMTIGETLSLGDVFIHRNEYGYVVFRELKEFETFENSIYVNHGFYRVTTLDSLAGYRIEDFEN